MSDTMDDTVSAVCRSLRPLTDTRVAAEELQRSLLQDLVLLSTNGAGIPGMICLNSGQDSIDNTLPMLFPYIDIPVALRWCASQLEIGYLCSDCRYGETMEVIFLLDFDDLLTPPGTDCSRSIPLNLLRRRGLPETTTRWLYLLRT